MKSYFNVKKLRNFDNRLHLALITVCCTGPVTTEQRPHISPLAGMTTNKIP